MTPQNFPQANKRFTAPKDLEESQCFTIDAFAGTVERGSVEGSPIVVTCWKPTDDEMAKLVAGGSIFLSVLGGLPPHYLSTSFEEATAPA